MDSHPAKTPTSEYTNSKTDQQISFNKTKKLILISFPVVVFICIVGYFAFDLPIAKYCKSNFSDYKIRRTLKDISKLGLATFYLICAGVAFVFFRFIRKREIWSNRALFVFLSISLSGVLVIIIKFIFGRYRPKMFFEEQLYGFQFFQLKGKLTSFPSGHASTIVALMLSLYLISPKYRVLYFIFGFVVVISRVAVYHHFLTDVIFGSYVAAITTLCLKHFLDKRGLTI
jgi:membrane-associated phospholipid phosphatase